VQLQHDLPTIRAAGAAVVGVSVDPIATSRGMADQLRLGYPIVQDVRVDSYYHGNPRDLVI